MARTRIKKSIKLLVNAYLNSLEKKEGLPIDAAYIFGSHARGTAGISSDIDVCLISSRFKNAHEALRWLWRNKPLTFSKIEPVGYSRKDFNKFKHPLIAEIQKTGVKVR